MEIDCSGVNKQVLGVILIDYNGGTAPPGIAGSRKSASGIHYSMGASKEQVLCGPDGML